MIEAAGAQWCARFPTSVSVDDLIEPFRGGVVAMLASLDAGGATHTIAATWRPSERAYLMHWCCMIALSGQDPAEVPAMPGVEIDWTCGGDLDVARLRAREMMAAYRIKFPAALISRHSQRRAIDMAIRLPTRPAKVTGFIGGDGKAWILSPADPQGLYRFGRTFGVIKLVKDEPHWSDDGH